MGILGKVIIRGGYLPLLQKWNLDRWYAGRNEHTMGIRGSKMVFLRPPYRGDWDRDFVVFCGHHSVGIKVAGFRKVRGRKR